jgi:hypothetical protein
MNTPYNYTVVSKSLEHGVMELRYESPGLPPVNVGMPLPRLGETVDDIAAMYAPTAVWDTQSTVYEDPEVGATGSYTPPGMVPSDLETAKTIKRGQIAQWRYAVEVNGISPFGSPIRTDRESQAQLTSAYASLRDGLVSSVDWKVGDGTFTTLGLAEVQAVAAAVAQHVQHSFTQERLLLEQVSAATTVAEVSAIRPDLGEASVIRANTGEAPPTVAIPVDRVVV